MTAGVLDAGGQKPGAAALDPGRGGLHMLEDDVGGDRRGGGEAELDAQGILDSAICRQQVTV